jgi:hypothetical protein
MIGREDAGFFGRLEDVALFEENDFTGQFPSVDDVSKKLEEEEAMKAAEVEKLKLKRTHLNVRSSFPYDVINLDFCQYYYSKPPGMLRINETVKKILDWQLMPSVGRRSVRLKEFLLMVTCRYDGRFPKEAEARLKNVIKSNCTAHQKYKSELGRSRKYLSVEEWAKKAGEDFFLAGWPKDIASSANERGWRTEILDYVFYRRTSDKKKPYSIVCLVLKFSRTSGNSNYLPAALYALDPKNRKLIEEIDKRSQDGRRVMGDLAAIVAIRNDQAKVKHREQLPKP